MKLKELSEKEFKKIADKSDQISFHQTSSWAKLKEKNGWDPYYLGLENDKGKIVCASLLLAKELPIIKKKMFYSPRGFLIDYNDKELLTEWTKEIKKFCKKEKAIFVKIDPYVEYQERDNNGNIVESGNNNKEAHQNLIDLGYKHFGFNTYQDTLQPRWMHVIETKGKTQDDVDKDMESKTRQILRKNERSGITVREIEKDELKLFKEIMQKTSDRREFVDRPFSYYEAMWDNLHDNGILKIDIPTPPRTTINTIINMITIAVFFLLLFLSEALFVFVGSSASFNNSSTDTLNNLAICVNLSISGVVCSNSHLDIVCLVTPNFSASSSCDNKFSFLNFTNFSLNFIFSFLLLFLLVFPDLIKLYNVQLLKSSNFSWNFVNYC